MDVASFIGELSELKKETLISVAKKVAFPLTLIPLLWVIFLRKTGVGDKGKVICKSALEGSASDILKDDSSYNLKNFVSFLPLVS